MTDEQQPESELPEEEFEARIFTLADYAEANHLNGKFYITGGGIANIWTAPVPGPLTPLYLAFRVRVPWRETGEPFNCKIRVLNADRTPVGPDPLFSRDAEMGRPPGFRPGDELAFNGALALAGFPLKSYGTIYFHLEMNGKTVAVHPLKIEPLSEAPLRLRSS